jgi:hypothetical protein
MRPLRFLLAALVLCPLLTSCGADKSIPLTTLTGNWFIYNINFPRTAQLIPFDTMGGPITQTGNNLTATFHIQSACFGNGQTPIPLTGSVNPENNHFTLNSTSVNGETIAVQETFSATKDTFLGTSLTLSGSCTGYLVSETGDEKGAILNPHGQKLPSLTGTWAFVQALPGPTLSEQLTQSPTPDVHGDFALSGTVNVNGSPCFTTGVLQSTSFISGSVGQQAILMNDGSVLSATIQFFAEEPPYGNSLNLQPGTITGGNCNGPIDVYLYQLAP